MHQKGRTHASGPLDVSHVMWSELQSTIYHRKVPIYGPYLFYLIRKTWSVALPNIEFEAPVWIRHEPIKLREKNKWANTTTTLGVATMYTDENEDAAEDKGIPDTLVPTSAEPSWAKKLKDQMKTLFCMHAKGQYLTHVAQKESR